MQPCLSPTMPLGGFCDANRASDVDDRRSTSRFCVFLGPNLISCQSKKKNTVFPCQALSKPSSFDGREYRDFFIAQ